MSKIDEYNFQKVVSADADRLADPAKWNATTYGVDYGRMRVLVSTPFHEEGIKHPYVASALIVQAIKNLAPQIREEARRIAREREACAKIAARKEAQEVLEEIRA